jgi:50S ribosomal subunit-associated GTPase HflX
VRVLLVVTKIDRIPKSKQRAVLDKLRAQRRQVLAVSATTGEGLDELWKALRATLEVTERFRGAGTPPPGH